MTSESFYLREKEVALLALLSEKGAVTTNYVAHFVRFGHNNRTRSGAVLSWMKEMQKRGLVSLLDKKKPLCWLRTGAGTVALQQHRPVKEEGNA